MMFQVKRSPNTFMLEVFPREVGLTMAKVLSFSQRNFFSAIYDNEIFKK